MSKAATQCSTVGACDSLAADAPGVEAGRPRWRGAPFLSGAIGWLRDQWRRRAVIGELNRLNDHFLRDIGIERGEIESVAETMVKRSRANRR
jgi:uncharacterized protein YjiS (DUF1127 family)